MKIVLVIPDVGQRVMSGIGRLFRPVTVRHQKIGPLLIAAALELRGHQVRVIDAEAQELDDQRLVRELADFGPDLVGIYANLMVFRHVLRSARAMKLALPRLPIVVGGPAVTCLPDAVMSHIAFDFGVVGEGERTIVELVDVLGAGHVPSNVKGIVFRDAETVVTTPPREPEQNLDLLPMAARHHVRFDLYRDVILGKRRFANVLCNRGCPYHCLFCDPKNKLGQTPRFRSVESIADELSYLKHSFGVEDIYFNDDTFTLNRRQILGLCERLLKDSLGISWSCRTRVNLVDYELLSMMREAGCERIDFGVESGDDAVLKALRKEITVGQTIEAFEACRRAGIETLAFFMIGGPAETRQTAKRTLRLAARINPTFVVPAQCQIFPPGTELVRIAAERGLVSSDHWERYIRDEVGEVAPPFITAQMSRRLGRLYLTRLHLINLLWPVRNPGAMFRGNPVSNLRRRLRVDLQILLMAVARRRVMI